MGNYTDKFFVTRQKQIGDDSIVLSLDCAPDGTQFAYSYGNELRIYDMVQNRLAFKQAIGEILIVKYSPDGQSLAIVTWLETQQMGQLIIWDLHSQNYAVLQAFQDQIKSLTFCPDGVHLAYGGRDKRIQIWNWKLKTQVAVLAYQNSITGLEYSPRGQFIIFSHMDCCIRILHPYTRQIIRRIFLKHVVRVIKVSPTKQLLISGSQDSTICIWSIKQTHKLIRKLQGHTNIVRSIAFSPDSTCIASSSQDRTIRFWSIQIGKQFNLGFNKNNKDKIRSFYTIQFSSDGNKLIIGTIGCFIRNIQKIYIEE